MPEKKKSSLFFKKHFSDEKSLKYKKCFSTAQIKTNEEEGEVNSKDMKSLKDNEKLSRSSYENNEQ